MFEETIPKNSSNKSVANQPTLVIVSDWIRWDLREPLRHFSPPTGEFKVVHLYRQAGYQDMKPEDFENPQAIQWHGMHDFWQKSPSLSPIFCKVENPGLIDPPF